jgi:hypothetical protein
LYNAADLPLLATGDIPAGDMITETHIRQWADRGEAKLLLPILVRRLVRETTPSLSSLRFPGNDAVALPGVDGETMADVSTPWVPSGIAFWEMGCDQTASKKATSDYEKRLCQLEAETRQVGAFVFVTPRRWPGKDKWLKERRARRDWAEVYAWDAVDIETWLEEAPATSLWLAERLGLARPGLASPEDWYRGWASAATPSIPTRLVAERRGRMGETFVQKLRDGDRTIPIVADSRQEAVAFSIATLLQAGVDDLLDRMLVVTSPDAVPSAGTGPKPIIVIDLPHDKEPALGDRNRFQIVRPMAKGQVATHEHLELPHVGAETFREALEEAGLSRDEASRKALEVGHSVTVLRRRLSDDPSVRQPHWARDAATAKALLPHALAGGWVEGERFQDLALLTLLANTSDEDVLRAGRSLSRGEDAPLVRIGNVTVAVSQLDALFALGAHIEPRDLDNFFLLAVDGLGERDPKLDLPEDEWWRANIHGKTRAYSETLLSGLGDTLGILATYGNAICGDRLGINLPCRIDRHVRDLMSNMTPDAWFSIRPHLRALAEAAPVAFLDCIEADLNRPNPPISTIMRCAGDVGLSQECLRTQLLWALEALAWSPKHFSRVAEIMFKLCAFPAEDNYMNKPTNTAAALFRDWVPSTTLGVEERMSILRRLAPTYRLPSIGVCKSLIASSPRFATRTAMPRWLTVEGDYETVTNIDCWNTRRAASGLLLDLAPLKDAEVPLVLDALGDLFPDDFRRLCSEIERWSKDADDQAKALVAKSVRVKRERLEFRLRCSVQDNEGEQENRETLDLLDRLLDQLRPNDPRQRHLWLFEQDYISWPALDRDVVDGKIDHNARYEVVQGERRKALEEIENVHGTDSLYEFTLNLKQPHVAARVLAGAEVPNEQTVRWAARAISDAEWGNQAEKFLAQALFIPDHDVLSDVVAKLQKRGLLSRAEDRSVLGRCLPSMRSGWQLAERLGAEVQIAYWGHAQIHMFDDAPNDEVEFVARRLLQAGRARSAFTAACSDPEKLCSVTWLDILHGIIHGDEPDRAIPDRWHLVRILQLLDTDPDIPDAQIAGVEWPFAALLENYGEGSERPGLAIHRVMMRDPSEFVALLRWLYRRSDNVVEPEMVAMEPEQREVRASMTYHVLHEWSAIPGTQDDGNLDEQFFVSWSEDVMRQAEEIGRLRPALSSLADCLARVAKRCGFDQWLPDIVLQFLDRPDLGELRRSFELGVYNARGVTSRGCFDGGAQERDLAKMYRMLATRQAISYPRVGAMVERIAERYERDAERQDEQAELGERWHP